MSVNNAQVAHIWAQQNGNDARNGKNNFWSRDRSLYSYKTEVARFIEGKVVYTGHRYSATTAGKHVNHIPRAVSHLEYYRTNEIMRDIPEKWDEVAPILFVEMMIGLKTEIERLRKARTVRYSVERIAESARDALAFLHKYFPEGKEPALPRTAINYPQLDNLTSNNATTCNETLRDTIESFGIDIRKKLANEAENDKKLLAKREKEHADLLKSLETKIAEWRNHERNDLPYGAPVMLRKNKNEIETSRGARVPIEAARALYSKIRSRSDVAHFVIGNFTVTSLTPELLTIGCHDIPMSEVEMIAKELNF